MGVNGCIYECMYRVYIPNDRCTITLLLCIYYTASYIHIYYHTMLLPILVYIYIIYYTASYIHIYYHTMLLPVCIYTYAIYMQATEIFVWPARWTPNTQKSKHILRVPMHKLKHFIKNLSYTSLRVILKQHCFTCNMPYLYLRTM